MPAMKKMKVMGAKKKILKQKGVAIELTRKGDESYYSKLMRKPAGAMYTEPDGVCLRNTFTLLSLKF